MKPSPTPRAWQSDPYWTEVATILANGKKLRPDHYLEGLNAEELDQLRGALSSSGSYAEQRLLCPKRRGGQTDGALPNISTLSEIAQAMRQVAELHALEAQQMIEAAVGSRCSARGLSADLTDAVLHAVAEETLKRRAGGVVDKFAVSAATVLMRRESQKLDERKIKLLEKKAAQADEAKGIVNDKQLSEAEKAERMRQLFGR
jgi:hypothetical protein